MANISPEKFAIFDVLFCFDNKLRIIFDQWPILYFGLEKGPEIQFLNGLYFQRVLKIVIVKKSPISVHLVIEKISI